MSDPPGPVIYKMGATDWCLILTNYPWQLRVGPVQCNVQQATCWMIDQCGKLSRSWQCYWQDWDCSTLAGLLCIGPVFGWLCGCSGTKLVHMFSMPEGVGMEEIPIWGYRKVWLEIEIPYFVRREQMSRPGMGPMIKYILHEREDDLNVKLYGEWGQEPEVTNQNIRNTGDMIIKVRWSFHSGKPEEI